MIFALPPLTLSLKMKRGHGVQEENYAESTDAFREAGTYSSDTQKRQLETHRQKKKKCTGKEANSNALCGSLSDPIESKLQISTLKAREGNNTTRMGQ